MLLLLLLLGGELLLGHLSILLGAGECHSLSDRRPLAQMKDEKGE